MKVNGYEIKAWGDLDGADLSGANLRNADLYGAVLRGADLREADLRDAILCGADLRGVDLHRADLRNANLCEANLHGADLRGADLHGADLRNVIGNSQEIKSLQLTKYYHISYTDDVLAIGCQQHTKKAWLAFTDDQISDMSTGMLEWWKEWKPKLEMLGVFDDLEVK